MTIAIATGSIVEVRDLVSRAELNGRVGVVDAFVPSSNRFKVALGPDTDPVAIRPDNLRVAPCKAVTPAAIATADLVTVICTLCSHGASDSGLADACSGRLTQLQLEGVVPTPEAQHKQGYPVQHCKWRPCLFGTGEALARGLVQTMTAHLPSVEPEGGQRDTRSKGEPDHPLFSIPFQCMLACYSNLACVSSEWDHDGTPNAARAAAARALLFDAGVADALVRVMRVCDAQKATHQLPEQALMLLQQLSLGCSGAPDQGEVMHSTVG